MDSNIGFFLLFSLLVLQTSGVEILTTDGEKCVPRFRNNKFGRIYRHCSTEKSPGLPYCATEVNDKDIAQKYGFCGVMKSCDLPTNFKGSKCVAFKYQGVDYPAGDCTYDGSNFVLPWCSIKEGATEFLGRPGEDTWDYCNAKCFVSSGSNSVLFDYDDPDTEWCKIPDSLCCPSGDTGRQSPINIQPENAQLNADLLKTPFRFDGGFFANIKGKVSNNGKTISFKFEQDFPTAIGGAFGTEFVHQLRDIHFHWGSVNNLGSEHTVNGFSYPLEGHLVFYNTKYDTDEERLTNRDGLAVMGFFFEIGDQSPFIESFLKNIRLPDSSEPTVINLADLLTFVPDMDNFVTYEGSLTTPLCPEIVRWINFLTPVQVSKRQMRILRTFRSNVGGFLRDNFRPTQPIGLRIVEKSK